MNSSPTNAPFVDMSEFLAPETVTADPGKKSNGKSQRSNERKQKTSPYQDKELHDLRKRAESMCKSYEQYRVVKRYSKQRLKDWVSQKDYESDAELRENLFSFVHKGYAALVDILCKGKGHVETHLLNDISLREAIEQEGRDLVKYLSNKSKIAVLTTSDVYQGKREQWDKTPVTIEEILPDECHDQTTFGSGEFVGHPDEGDADDDDEVVRLPEREEDMQEACEAVPGDNSGEAARDDHFRSEGEWEVTPLREAVEEPSGVEEVL